MTLTELKERVDRAVEFAAEEGQSPSEILVTLQINDVEGGGVFSDKEVELHYDNNCFASGCVLTAEMDFEDSGTVL